MEAWARALVLTRMRSLRSSSEEPEAPGASPVLLLLLPPHCRKLLGKAQARLRHRGSRKYRLNCKRRRRKAERDEPLKEPRKAVFRADAVDVVRAMRRRPQSRFHRFPYRRTCVDKVFVLFRGTT